MERSLNNPTSEIRIAADVGGTFTDLVFLDENGRLTTRKVPSTPPDFDRAIAEALDASFQTEGIEPTSVSTVCHGTTVATNAVLERRGARTALITTRGFRDVLELRRIRAPQLYDLFFDKSAPIIPRNLRFEISERMGADGEELKPIDESELDQIAQTLDKEGIESVAVCLIHAYAFPDHEKQIGDFLHEHCPGIPVSLSHVVLRQRREYERTATTAVNAYVRPVMRGYLDRLRTSLTTRRVHAPLSIMQSAGGLTTADDAAARPVFALESGPAAGVLAAATIGSASELVNLLSLDMGGTTAKAALIEGGKIPYSAEYEVGATLSAGNRLTGGGGEVVLAPSIDIAEVGAGGGSIAWLDIVGGLRVGPQSAGALPGPACYGRGGSEPTVTDANVALGYVKSGPLGGGDIVIDADTAYSSIKENIAEPLNIEPVAAAHGIHHIANAQMLRALREVSVHRGRDPRDFTIVAFGGSGPIHAAHLADELGSNQVLIPPRPGVFSAVGLLASGIEHHDVRSCQIVANSEAIEPIQILLDEMTSPMLNQFATESIEPNTISFQPVFDMRYTGEPSDIRIEVDHQGKLAKTVDLARAMFEEEHHRLYGYAGESGSEVEIVAIRLIGRTEGGGVNCFSEYQAKDTLSGSRTVTFEPTDGAIEVPVVSRTGLHETPGPLLIDEYDATIVVPPDWVATTDPLGSLILNKPMIP